MKSTHCFCALVLGLAATVLNGQQPKRIDQNALKRAPARPDEWLTSGRDYAEIHYSPPKLIDDKNISRLGLAWSYDTQTMATFEGTPLIADGVIYATGSWSITFAVDARTGKGMVYVGVLDGRLIALDQKTGRQVWSVKTSEDEYQSITGAPRVVSSPDGHFVAYSAEKDEKLWDVTIGDGIATPVTWLIDGKQYVAVLAGRNGCRLFTFALDAKEPIPALPPPPGRGRGAGRQAQ